MNLKVLVGKKIPFIKFLEIEELDNKAYFNNYSLSIFKGLFWAIKSRSGYIALLDKKQVVAYVSLVSIKEKYYNLLKEGNIKDINLPINAIKRINKKGIHYLYLSSIVIEKKYQNSHACLILMKEVEKLIINMHSKGIYFKSVLADAVSIKGNMFCNLLGFNHLKDSSRNTKIYEANLIPYSCNLKGSLGKNIMTLYSNITL